MRPVWWSVEKHSNPRRSGGLQTRQNAHDPVHPIAALQEGLALFVAASHQEIHKQLKMTKGWTKSYIGNDLVVWKASS